MKKIILILFIFNFLQCWSQKTKKSKYQKEIYIEAQSFLNKSDYLSAIKVFDIVNKLNPNSDLGKLAKIKSDSIRQIPRRNLIGKIIGKWQLKKTGSNWGFEDYKDSIINQILIIDENRFSFFEQNQKTKDMKLVKVEDFKFLKNNDEGFYSSEFVFFDNQIWVFMIIDETGNLRQINTGEVTSTGRTEIVCGNLELYYFRIED